MGIDRIQSSLRFLFHEEGQRIVFWNDPHQEFQNTLPYLKIDNVTVLRLDQIGALEAKIRIERTEPATKFLLYSPADEPDFLEDWLLDIRLYSRSFRADKASILLQELGLVNQQLRSHLEDRRKFFDSKDRVQKLKNLVEPNDVAADLDRKMIAVLAKTDVPELFNLVHAIFHAWNESEEEIELDSPPAVWGQIEKFDLDVPFWKMVKATFGYDEENPTLKNFLLQIMVTDFAHHLKDEVPQSIRGLVLPKSLWANSVVCLAKWRDSLGKSESYDRLSAEAAAILKIEDSLRNYEVEQLVDVMTFLVVEKQIAGGLRERIQETAETINADDVRGIASQRQSGYWASSSLADSPNAPRAAFHAAYDSLVAAAEFYALRNHYKSSFEYPDASAMYRAYESDLFRFDQLYRHFCESADIANDAGWNICKGLREDIEAHYNSYLIDLALAWNKFVEPMLSKWKIENVPNQYRFFDRNVLPRLEEAVNRRAFVIVSDAFRYEAAQELTAELNGRYRFEATLSSQLGVLPSYTALGMASLLPHKTLSYKGTDVLVDGRLSNAGERDGILQSIGGVACKSDELMSKKKEEGREFIKDKRVVYIYHNTIDAIGDAANTEEKTFEAVRRAINELANLVGYIVNALNGNHIVITADHGFLFTESARVETEKSKLKDKPSGTVLAKKRYLLGQKLPDNDAAWHGKMSVTAATNDDMEFWVPKGTNLFHFVGGARFVHGGAMLQEIVVPVVTVKQLKGKSAQETKTKPVTVQVYGTNHRITSAYHRFQLIQMEPVSDRVKAITLKVAVYEGDEPVSDTHSVKFDSTSGNFDERKKWINLVLSERQYNKKTPYRLVLRDAETGIEQQSVPIIIDRAFTDDF